MPDPDAGRARRNRLVYAAAAAVVIALGLWCRSDAAGLPWVVAKYAGDTLWGLVVFLGVALLRPRRSTLTVASLAVAFACAVEASQLIHEPWLDRVRETVLGGLVLGTPASTFAWWDIVAYLGGIAFGAAAERCTGASHRDDR